MCEFSRSRSFLDIGPVIYISKITLAFLRNHWTILTKFCMQAFRYREMKMFEYDVGHMTKMAAILIYGKNP